MTHKTVKIGIIGLGSWGKNYLRIFSSHNKTKIIKICDKKTNQSYKFNFTSNYRNILNDKSIEAVIISTGASTHYNLCKAALENKKHVLIEKPLTTNYNQALKLKKLSERNKKVLMIGHTFLYNSAIIYLKKIIAKVGKIYYINCKRTHTGPIRKDTNVIWDLAPHDVSIINFLLDSSPKNIFSVGAKHLQSNNEDVSFINLFYDKNILANIHVSWEDSNKSRTIEIVGSRSRIIFDDLNLLEPIKIYNKAISHANHVKNFSEFQYVLRDGSIVSPKIIYKEPLKVMCDDFINSIIKKKKPKSNASVGVEIVKIIDLINKKIKIN
jgi:predicted dehydrogenase